ncbi:hypothetical protein ACUSIJ_13985 [Pseudochelatococcus sp. B33]
MTKTIHDHWKEQAMTTAGLSLDDLRRRETQIDRATRRRNMLEYVAGGAAAAFLAVMSVFTFMRAEDAADFVLAGGFALLVAGMLVAGRHLHRNSRKLHTDLAQNGIAHLRRRLERERNLLRSAWLWYVGPMVPGFALIYAGAWMASPDNPTFPLVAGGLTFLFLIGVAFLNRHAAKRIGHEIDELERTAPRRERA